MFSKLKNKIKLAKISGIIFGIIFILMIISNIYLNIKIVQVENQIELLK